MPCFLVFEFVLSGYYGHTVMKSRSIPYSLLRAKMCKEKLLPLQNGIVVHALFNIVSFAAKQATDKLEQYMADVLYGRRQCEKRSRG